MGSGTGQWAHTLVFMMMMVVVVLVVVVSIIAKNLLPLPYSGYKQV
jgi:hypothetical protein